MKNKKTKSKKGFVIIGVIVFAVIFIILSFSLLSLANSEVLLTHNKVNRVKAFYLAEAGLGRLTVKLNNKKLEDIEEAALEGGTYAVKIYYETIPYAISTGRFGGEEKKIKAELSFLARPYEDAVYAGSTSGDGFVFELRGQGVPQYSGGREIGGADIVNGNIFIDGDITLYEQSRINPLSFPNLSGVNGDVEATGNINILDEASISGEISQHVDSMGRLDLTEMQYQLNNTHNVGQIFADSGIDSGRLPLENELSDVVVKNPSDRLQECISTSGDDYFFEPESGFVTGDDQKLAETPLDLGNERVYYVDGNVWIHSQETYGFLTNGKATIVATGDILVCDNVKYADSDSVIGLVALGNYDAQGKLKSGGNIYFGDPRFGTTYTVSAIMFAANDFLYNTDSVTGSTEEPQTGFSIYGNFSALNGIYVRRDWYDDASTGLAMPTYFDSSIGQWVDLKDGATLTSSEISSLRHYKMEITYDDRLRIGDARPPSLPRGGRSIFAGISHWQEL